MRFRHVILDRDGVLNEEAPGEGYLTEASQFRWLPGALEALATLRRDGVRLSVPKEAGGAARLLLLGGVPLREPVARYGPFVMNSPEEIRQAIVAFQEGRLGEIAR